MGTLVRTPRCAPFLLVSLNSSSAYDDDTIPSPIYYEIGMPLKILSIIIMNKIDNIKNIGTGAYLTKVYWSIGEVGDIIKL